MAVLALGIGWITSSINVFARDTAQIVNVVLQFGFWATPIFWDLEILPEEAQSILQLNPMFYIVQGYRDSFLYGVPFWQHYELTLYYWGLTGIVFVVGAIIFMRLSLILQMFFKDLKQMPFALIRYLKNKKVKNKLS